MSNQHQPAQIPFDRLAGAITTVRQVLAYARSDIQLGVADSDTDVQLQHAGRSILAVWAQVDSAIEGAAMALVRLKESEREPADETAQFGDPRTPAHNGTRLNPAYSFGSFVEGATNQLAIAAAKEVADMLGDCSNPLFIASPVGIGKTHLLHAVGNRMLEKYPEAKVLYRTAELFVNDVLDAYRHKTFDEFHKRYRSLDALLLDDVEFLANKEHSQEELRWVMDALVSRKSQVVISGDTRPHGLTDIHERLVSRLNSGLVVAIEPPSAETRAAILLSKAGAAGITLPEEVATMVARMFRNDVRALLGALHKIMAYSRFHQQEISVLLAYRALDMPSEDALPRYITSNNGATQIS